MCTPETVVQSLQAAGVTDVNHFDWQAQLRYYWNHLDDSIEVKLMHTTLPYQCEYIGSTQRLVMAPLTDRCYRTLAAAIHLNMAGATEGPSGYGQDRDHQGAGKGGGHAVCQLQHAGRPGCAIDG